MTDYLPLISSVVVAVVGGIFAWVTQRRVSKSQALNATIDQFQEQAAAATARADQATSRADSLQTRVDDLWEQMQRLRRDFMQQIEWRDIHIARLVSHIHAGKPPPPPAAPEGIHRNSSTDEGC